MRPPISMNKDWVLDYFNSYLQKMDKNFIESQKSLYKKYKCNELFELDLKSEIEWILDLINKTESPVVFCHNDLRQANIMITESNDEVIFCDFDHSSYGYRGFDFGYFFCFFFDVNIDSFSKQFIKYYIKENEEIFGKKYSENPINSLQYILNESKVFVLLAYIYLSIIFFLHNIETNGFPLTAKQGTVYAIPSRF